MKKGTEHTEWIVFFVSHSSDKQQLYPSDPKQHNCPHVPPEKGDAANL
jgi:hypothetical protein